MSDEFKKRIDALTAQKKELAEQVRALTAERDALTEAASAFEGLEARALAAEEALSTATAGWSTERELFQAGMTSAEGQAFAKLAWSQLDAASRPSIGEWLASGELPAGVRVYLPAPEAPAADRVNDSGSAPGHDQGSERRFLTSSVRPA